MVAFLPNGQIQVQNIDTVDVNEKYIFKIHQGHAQKRPLGRHTFVREENINVDSR